MSSIYYLPVDPHSFYCIIIVNLFFFSGQRHGFPLKVPDEWKAKIDVCLSKAKFDGQETNFVKSFMLNGFDTLSVGTHLTYSFYKKKS